MNKASLGKRLYDFILSITVLAISFLQKQRRGIPVGVWHDLLRHDAECAKEWWLGRFCMNPQERERVGIWLRVCSAVWFCGFSLWYPVCIAKIYASVHIFTLYFWSMCWRQRKPRLVMLLLWGREIKFLMCMVCIEEKNKREKIVGKTCVCCEGVVKLDSATWRTNETNYLLSPSRARA